LVASPELGSGYCTSRNVDHLFGRISLLTGDPNAAASRRAASQARFSRNHDPALVPMPITKRGGVLVQSSLQTT
jgi:hypothetical protein